MARPPAPAPESASINVRLERIGGRPELRPTGNNAVHWASVRSKRARRQVSSASEVSGAVAVILVDDSPNETSRMRTLRHSPATTS